MPRVLHSVDFDVAGNHLALSDLHGEDVDDPVLLSHSPSGPPLSLVLIPGNSNALSRSSRPD